MAGGLWREEAEANAIGTEYVRADFVPAEAAAKVRELLKRYTDQRIAFYLARDQSQVGRVNADTAELQGELWSSVVGAVTPQQTPVTALVVSGMNDVLNSQGYTQAAWWNRIPVAAWGLMGLIALACNLLLGYGERSTSPRGGAIHVSPQTLIALSNSMKPQ